MNDIKFALDIGTRKIGIFATRNCGGRVEVLAHKIIEHKSRAVRAGQIHDIDKVAALVSDIKASIEKDNGFEIKKISTAIAGRNLRSVRSAGELKFEVSREISENDIRQAELYAVESAVNGFQNETDGYYFVGHTVVFWQLDGETISNPLSHYANSLKVEVIATFLPKKVLESLFAVTKKAGLEITYLTLEPIAAAESVLPQEMRYIPIALVDIGAGTSDIALVSGGSIQSFGMIPSAGDSITERLCSELLVDFNEAERIKRAAGGAGTPGSVKYSDIFLKEYEKSTDEVSNIIQPAVKELAGKIALEISSLVSIPNAEQKNYAVVLVGGGSLTGGLAGELASALGIAESRVGLRSPAMVNKFILNLQLLKDINAGEADNYNVSNVFGPQTAVLLGVANLAEKMPSAVLVHVTINNKEQEIINFKEGGLTVISALLAGGISRQKITGRVGLAKTFTLNGEKKVIKGKLPQVAAIAVNGEPAGINTVLKEGDRIDLTPAKDGEDARGKISDVLPAADEFIFNGNSNRFPLKVTVNGRDAAIEEEITDNCVIEARKDSSLAAVLASAGVPIGALTERSISFDILGQVVERKIRNCVLKINGAELLDLNDISGISVNAGDNIVYENIKPSIRAGELISVPEKGRDLRIKINEEEFSFPGSSGKILLNGREVAEDTEVSDGDIIRTVSGRDAEAVLVDIFRYISLEPKDTAGKRLKLLVNQQEANFTTPLSYDADVKISFE